MSYYNRIVDVLVVYETGDFSMLCKSCIKNRCDFNYDDRNSIMSRLRVLETEEEIMRE